MAPSSKYDNGRVAQPLIPRLLSRATVTATDCWIWNGEAVKGYGRATIGSRRDGTRRKVVVHKAAWESIHGPVPAGMTLDHIVCDTTLCFNPAHLALATSWDNTKRSSTSPTAINARKVNCSQCGGPLTPKTSGSGRDCRPCRLAYLKEYNARRYGTG